MEDADHVLKNLDAVNVKALNRRATANKNLDNVEDSIRDFQQLLKVNPAGEVEIKKELGVLMKKLVDLQKEKKEAAAQKPVAQETTKAKIQEVTTSIPAKETPKQTTPPAAAEEQKEEVRLKGPAKTKQIDAETLNKAVEISSEKINKKLLNKVPVTAAGFESDFMSLKKDLPTFYGYVKNVPIETIPKLFKTVEISAELLAAILKVLVEHGLSDADGVKHAAQLIVAMSKADNFDMTLMFMDKLEKQDLVTIISTLKNQLPDLDLLKQVNTIYKL